MRTTQQTLEVTCSRCSGTRWIPVPYIPLDDRGRPIGPPRDLRDAAVRNATQIRALSTHVLEARQLGDTTFRLIHNKHRNSTGLKLGVLELQGAQDEPFVRLALKAADTGQDAVGKRSLARKLLTELGQSMASGWITRKILEASLNDPGKPVAERVSKKIFEPVLDAMVTDGLFKTGQVGNADAWQWVARPGTRADLDGDAEPEMF